MTHATFTRLLLPATLLAASIAPVPAMSQAASNVTVYATGLQGPRGLKFGPDGMLYVAEAGTGGTTTTTPTQCAQVVGPVGPYANGKTGRISRIDSKGNVTTVASGFPSAVNSTPTNDTFSVSDVAFLGNTLYALLSGGGCSHGSIDIPNGLAKVNLANGSWNIVSDLSKFVHANPAKYPDPDDFEPDGVFYGLIASNDRLYAVESNHGQIISFAPNGTAREEIDVSASQSHIVPTTIAASNGNFYMGNLNLFPVIPTSARVQTLSYNQGLLGSLLSWLDPKNGNGETLKIIDSKAGFTSIVASAFGPDGLLYLLELTTVPGNPTPGTGEVVRIARNGDIQSIATGLVVPTGMTFGPDGRIYVSNFGAAPPGTGQIVRIDLP